MKGIILFNSELGQCEMYEPSAETMTRVWDLLNNKHNRTPVSVPDVKATRTAASNTKGGRIIELRYDGKCAKCHDPIARGRQARYFGRGHIEHITCPEREAPKQVTPEPVAEYREKPNGSGTDANFMTSLASLMQSN